MEKFVRKCPACDKVIEYKNKYSLKNAERDNRQCKSCAIKLSITEERRENMRLRILGENNPMFGKFGELNPFFGKTHTNESKIKMIENKDYSTYKTEEFKEKMSKLSSGENNNMYGKSVYDIWVKKYGIEMANNKLTQLKIKQSKNSSGENNPMFGKPSPTGSGNGWSGWYKGWYFRSIKELSYMINIIERNNISWVTAESNEFKMTYLNYKNQLRTYTADFILNDKYLIEIKPKKLWSSDSVIRKQQAAVKFCKDNNLIYKLRDIPNLNTEELKKLYESKTIIFTERYDKKFIDRLYSESPRDFSYSFLP